MSPRPTIPPTKREFAISALLLLVVVIAIQFHAEAFSTDLSAHPDEPAHAVTGLMLRDYITGGFIETPHPMQFARNYYDHYPKVALGHYPPGFYLLEGLWLVPVRSITACVTLLTALATTWLLLTHVALRKAFPGINPYLLLVPTAAIPLVSMVGNSLVMVMSDLLLALCCLAATMAMAKFIEKPSAKWSLCFGFLAAAAGLTKASGLLLALVPPLACVLSGQVRLLVSGKLWLAPVPVILTVIPWILGTRHITQEGMQQTPILEFIPTAAQFYASALVAELGPALLILAALFTLATGLHWVRHKRAPDPNKSALISLAIATVVFYSIIPAGLETRYLLPAAPAIVSMAVGGAWLIQSKLKPPPIKVAVTAVVAGAAIAGFQALPEPVGSGFDTITDQILADSTTPLTVLVSSDAVGEGAVIATAAFNLPPIQADNWKFLRSTKTLSQSDWMGRDYESHVAGPEELASLLDSEGVSVLLEDESIPERLRLPHNKLIEQFLIEYVPATALKQVPVVRTAHSDRQGEGAAVVADLRKPTEKTK